MLKKRRKIFNYILSTLFFSIITGLLAGTVIVIFKAAAAFVIDLSGKSYALARENPLLIFIGIGILAVIALGYTLLYRVFPNAKGGGIPNSVGILRGILPIDWFKTTVTVFFASLVTFFTGVPLGTEGPSVQIGTAIGKGVSLAGGKKRTALDRYIMTGGASAGFTVATGSPIAGLVFALEEAHQSISPLIMIAGAAAVVAAKAASNFLSPIFGVSPVLFHHIELIPVTPKDFWMPVVISLAVGFISVAFLKYYTVLHDFWKKIFSKSPVYVKILSVLVITFALGLVSSTFISTGHSLTDILLHPATPIYMIVLALIIRSSLMIIASSSGITGGMFLPIMALGALVASLLGNIFILLGMDASYYPFLVMLGITAAVSGMMKMPLTASVFAIEALSLSGHILSVLITTTLAFLVVDIFGSNSITESVLENRIHSMHKRKKPQVYEAFVTVCDGTFAVGKQARDVLWPSNMIILSVKHSDEKRANATELGEKILFADDVLHIRLSTYNINETYRELSSLIGEQKLDFAEQKEI
nr:chloride channel protein [Clostridia bacterium]